MGCGASTSVADEGSQNSPRARNPRRGNNGETPYPEDDAAVVSTKRERSDSSTASDIVDILPRFVATGEKNATDTCNDCSICLTSKHDTTVIVFPCLHSFHYACARRWLEKSNRCPICRTEVSIDNYQWPTAMNHEDFERLSATSLGSMTTQMLEVST